MKISELKINTILRVLNKMKLETTIFSFLITKIEFKKDSKDKEYAYVGCIPCNKTDSIQCGFGYIKIFDVPEQWGVQSFEFVENGKEIKPQNYPSLVGNPGYDLMHDPAPQYKKDDYGF